MFGLQPEQRELVNSTATRNYATASTSKPELQVDTPIKRGGEYYAAAYLQADQTFLEQIEVNVGLRYDYYRDIGGAFNPRVALTYNPFEHFYWKAMYGKSFLNPSYFYRYVTGVMGYYGGPDLEPEIMDSYQTNVYYQFEQLASLAVGYFYNALQDLVAPDKSDPGRLTYMNYGIITIYGIETEIKIQPLENLEIFANHTFQEPISWETDASQIKDESIKYLPKHTANVGFNYIPVKYCNINVSLNYQGKIEHPTTSAPAYGADYELPEVFLLNMNLRFMEFWQSMEVAVNITNVLDKEYYLGITQTPVRQPGRWILGTVSYKF